VISRVVSKSITASLYITDFCKPIPFWKNAGAIQGSVQTGDQTKLLLQDTGLRWNQGSPRQICLCVPLIKFDSTIKGRNCQVKGSDRARVFLSGTVLHKVRSEFYAFSQAAMILHTAKA